eukprot:520881_1
MSLCSLLLIIQIARKFSSCNIYQTNTLMPKIINVLMQNAYMQEILLGIFNQIESLLLTKQFNINDIIFPSILIQSISLLQTRMNFSTNDEIKLLILQKLFLKTICCSHSQLPLTILQQIESLIPAQCGCVTFGFESPLH